jgi:hypothetical protein
MKMIYGVMAALGIGALALALAASPTQQPVEAEVGGQCLAPIVATSKVPADPEISTTTGLIKRCLIACHTCNTDADCPAHDHCSTGACL